MTDFLIHDLGHVAAKRVCQQLSGGRLVCLDEGRLHQIEAELIELSDRHLDEVPFVNRMRELVSGD